ncbi:MAG: sensor histidine kinase [Firmicutes bacterium HGW-Firmicutes-15]|nr:MAG: sensor histidine kinase [Firmicutes bacterium HGW-Firmicutes-15]
MSIRLRLLLSYIAMLVVPVVLTIVVGGIIAHAYLGDIKDIYNFDMKPNSVESVIKEQASAFEQIQLTTSKDPDKLMDIAFLQGLDKKFNLINSGIVVRKKNQIIYTSNIVNDPDISNKLPPYGGPTKGGGAKGEPHNDREPLLIGDNLFFFQQFDFSFTDYSTGSVFIVSDVSPIGKLARDFLGSFFLAILLILVITNGLLTYIVSRSILKPIEALKNAAGQIKEGNLNFKVKTDSNDEIGQLSRTFEEMRCKLQESIELQMQYEENRKELISNISHDLKTPIAAIKGYTEGIMDGIPDSPEKLEKYIQTIHSKAIDVDKLIDELFLFSKLDLKREPFNFEKVEMISYLQHSTEELLLDLNKKGIQLKFETDHDKPLTVIADREKLKRVINNIIDNSVKYMDKSPGEISITLQDGSDRVTIGIRDNGQGISQAALSLIFDRFYRADPSRNTTIQGSGLGLSIAQRIIEEHGGRIWAESKEGVGTSIFFTLEKGSKVDL